MKDYTCDQCGCSKPGKKAKNNGESPPMNWRRVQDRLLCKDCFTQAYGIKCVTIRVASPVDATWDELRKALRYAWGETRRIANWAIRQLALHDPVIGVDQKAAKQPKQYLYGLCNEQGIRGEFPADATLATITRAEAIYKRDRFKIITGRASLPQMRGMPFCGTPTKNSLTEANGGERMVVQMRIPISATESRAFRLLVAGGWENVRTRRAMQRMIAGEVDLREVKIDEQGKHVMLGLVALFPREVDKGRTGTLYVRSTSEVFCESISVQKQRLWVIHADLAKRWIGEHRKRLQNLSDDQKAEQRSGRARKRYQEARDAACDKHARRMKTWLQQAVAMIAGWADRTRSETVLWDGWADGESSPNEQCFESFPWHQFRDALESKLAEKCVKLITHASGEVTEKAA